MKEIYSNIDYLEIKLLWEKIKILLNSLVVNSPEVIIWDYCIRLRDSFRNWDYLIYDIIYADNYVLKKDIKIGSINYIKAKTSKNGVFLSFPWLPFKNYGAEIVYHFLDSIDYNYTLYHFQVFRLDFCKDFEDSEVQWFTKRIDFSKLSFNNFPIRFDTKDKKPTRFVLPFTDDLLRVYNKKLDISDRGTSEKIPWYKDYLKNKNYITRVEVQLKRNKFKNKIITDLSDLFDYWESVLTKKLNKYFLFNIAVSNIVFSKDIDYLEISYQKEYEFSRKMFLAYKNKLIANPYWIKFLKSEFIELEKTIFWDTLVLD